MISNVVAIISGTDHLRIRIIDLGGKVMGLFGNRESSAEIESRIRNSEAAQLFANAFCNMLSDGDEHYGWLMANSKERMYKLEVFKNGVQLKSIEVNRNRLKATGTYDVDCEGWSFGASGYGDLPNSNYVYAFRRYLIEQITANCPNIEFSDDYIKLSESAKKGW